MQLERRKDALSLLADINQMITSIRANNMGTSEERMVLLRKHDELIECRDALNRHNQDAADSLIQTIDDCVPKDAKKCDLM